VFSFSLNQPKPNQPKLNQTICREKDYQIAYLQAQIANLEGVEPYKPLETGPGTCVCVCVCVCACVCIMHTYTSF